MCFLAVFVAASSARVFLNGLGSDKNSSGNCSSVTDVFGGNVFRVIASMVSVAHVFGYFLEATTATVARVFLGGLGGGSCAFW